MTVANGCANRVVLPDDPRIVPRDEAGSGFRAMPFGSVRPTLEGVNDERTPTQMTVTLDVLGALQYE